MKALRIGVSCFAVLGGLTATTISIPGGGRAQADEMCPFMVTQYCVAEKDGNKHIAWTNTCLAKKQGIKIIKAGPCS
jgi:hypothetical protein